MKKIYKYIILILGIVLLLIGGISLYFTRQASTEKLDINSALVQQLYGYIDHGSDNSGLSVYLLTADSINQENIDDAFKFVIALRNMDQSSIEIDELNCQASFSKSLVDKSMKTIFNNTNYDQTKEYSSPLKKHSNCGGIMTFKYDSNSNKFIGDIYALGGLEGFKSPYQTKLYEAYKDKKNKNIQIKEKVLYLKETCEDQVCSYEIYKDFNYKEKIGREENLNVEQEYDFFDKYLNQASTVTYTFKLENNNYYFYSSKVDK